MSSFWSCVLFPLSYLTVVAVVTFIFIKNSFSWAWAWSANAFEYKTQRNIHNAQKYATTMFATNGRLMVFTLSPLMLRRTVYPVRCTLKTHLWLVASFKDVIFVEMLLCAREKRVDMFLAIYSSGCTTLFRLDMIQWIATLQCGHEQNNKK